MERTCNYSPVLCACLRPNSNGEPRPRRRGGFVDIWGEVGNTGRGYIIDYICEFTARKFLNTRTSSVPRRSTSRWNPAARCRKTDAGIQTPSPPPFTDHFLILLNSSGYTDGFLESKGMDGNLSKEFFSLRNE